MVELRSYFCQTYYKHEYYVNMFQDLLTWRDSGDEFWIYDEQDAIDKFKELIQPYNPNNPMIDTVNDNIFIYLCNYLNDIGYYIEEFPNFLERPTERWDLSYDKIRKKIIERDTINLLSVERFFGINHFKTNPNPQPRASDNKLKPIFLTTSIKFELVPLLLTIATEKP